MTGYAVTCHRLRNSSREQDAITAVPATAAEVHEVLMASHKPLHSDVHGQLCILSVDDDQVNLMVIEQLLRPQGWKVISTSDGDEALGSLEEESFWPDAVLLDYTLAGETGDEVCIKLRKVLGSVDIPIIMCTALTSGHDALAVCMAAGASDYILKPYDQGQMVEKIKKFCGSKAQRAAPAVVAAPEPAPIAQAAPAASSSAAADGVEALCRRIDLEYCGKKLEAAGFTLDSIKGADDAALRKAGIVIKAQRDKILEAAKLL